MNWLVSSGSSGFWFCNCVVSSVKKVWKLSAIPVLGDEDDVLLLLELVLVVVAETTGLGMVASTGHSDLLRP